MFDVVATVASSFIFVPRHQMLRSLKKESFPKNYKYKELAINFGLYPGSLEWILVLPFSQIIKNRRVHFYETKNNVEERKKIFLACFRYVVV
ncbi:hypothetical protein BpHYR1_041659 [Brachionus plicatilis]|uniref:Uncharacterized protein n=1 Tax=Brachionus plicatilis TaxID=10195 RepID=A0A3M7STF3_BRAPC|nr:hypothetical protein BpHYR1_041659 [Brachionus plicatilis]